MTRVIGPVGLLLLSVVLLEALLQTTRMVSPYVDYVLSPPWTWAQPIEDSILTVRGNPLHPEHDANGYRNPEVPETAHLISEADERAFELPLDEEVRQLVPEPEQRAVSPIRRFVPNHSNLYALLRSTRAVLSPDPGMDFYSKDFERAVASLTDEQRSYYSAIEGSDWRTVLTPAQRAKVLDVEDPRIRLGFEVCSDALVATHLKAEEAGADLLVVLLPTKESVFKPHVANPEEHANLVDVWESERQLGAELKRRLGERGIRVLNPIAALSHAHRQTYFEDADGHPNAWGHEIIAREIGRVLMAAPEE
jgi:hypothetical protein